VAAPPRLIVIRRKLPSQNDALYRHWRKYTTERDVWFVLLRAQLPPRQQVEVPVTMAIRAYRTRLMDYANVVGGAKPIPDCLIRLGYLKDDSPKWFSCTYEQFQVKKPDERTEIEFLTGL
jgi:hypothetical protein